MTEPNCECRCEAHWHKKYGPGVGTTREWRPQGGKRGRCTAFISVVNRHGFRVRCGCRQYRQVRAA